MEIHERIMVFKVWMDGSSVRGVSLARRKMQLYWFLKDLWEVPSGLIYERRSLYEMRRTISIRYTGNIDMPDIREVRFSHH